MNEARLTLCPACDRPMQLASITPRAGFAPVETLECHFCCVAVTQAQAVERQPAAAGAIATGAARSHAASAA
jgi:hypothetical protein